MFKGRISFKSPTSRFQPTNSTHSSIFCLPRAVVRQQEDTEPPAAFLAVLQNHWEPECGTRPQAAPGTLFCVFRWRFQQPQGPREPFVKPRSEKHNAVKEFTSLLHFPSICIPLPATPTEKQDPGPLPCPPYVQGRRLTSILRYAALPVPLIKREKFDLTNLRLHPACHSQNNCSVPNTQGFHPGTAQGFGCLGLSVSPQHLPAR